MEERFIETALINSVEQLVSANIQVEIDKKVEDFRRQLEYRKDQYIAEVMKGIRIYHERDLNSMGINYHITFENVYKLESEDK